MGNPNLGREKDPDDPNIINKKNKKPNYPNIDLDKWQALGSDSGQSAQPES